MEGGEADITGDGQVCGGWQTHFQLGPVDGLWGASTKLGSSGAGPGSAEMMHSMLYRLSLMYFLKYWTR